MTGPRAPVAIETRDLVSGHGLAQALSQAPQVQLTDWAQCDVLILLTDRADERLLALMRERFAARSGEISCIVIADEITGEQLSVAAALGLIALLHRAAADPDRVLEAIALTRSVRPPLPAVTLPLLLQRFEAAATSPLGDLETKVLLLYADGLSSAEVSRRLGLPRSRVTKIVLEVRGRLNLRSRTHAVAYAVRSELSR
ncbi:response regulator transcription factor [Winogradskya consettensis]|uniref:Helix-turn-helix transcriptional regulator n=1 Tax=Winogradskya consettensis TaxID=113560 RepID=A0A919SB26_9ACTN|nr:hypothetical protein [Actinoplanes consettensis]GIM68231.1 helix-turn-helix transcriptional regulator [Actinoplanes consettensis]